MRKGGPSPEPLEGAQPCLTWILDVWAPEPWKNKSLCQAPRPVAAPGNEYKIQ